MLADQIRFQCLEEHRDWYYVEYSPPANNNRFSILSVCVVEAADSGLVAEAMEFEAKHWLHRFPVPLMATAFTADDSVFSLEAIRPIDHLIAWRDENSLEPILRWELVADSELPGIALEKKRLLEIFSETPYKTSAEIQLQAKKDLASHRLGIRLILVWAVLVPLGVAILEWWSDLLGLAVLAYAFFKAIHQWLKLTGRLPKADSQVKREAEDLEARHHHYHCKLNPAGFLRLKIENYRNEAIKATQEKSRSLKGKLTKGVSDG